MIYGGAAYFFIQNTQSNKNREDFIPNRGYSNTGKSIRMEPNNNRHFDSNHFRNSSNYQNENDERRKKRFLISEKHSQNEINGNCSKNSDCFFLLRNRKSTNSTQETDNEVGSTFDRMNRRDTRSCDEKGKRHSLPDAQSLQTKIRK